MGDSDGKPDERDPFAPPPEPEQSIALEAPSPKRAEREAPPAGESGGLIAAADRAVAPLAIENPEAAVRARKNSRTAVAAVHRPTERPRGLRDRPLLRVAIGVALGLALGWFASLPYARRSERVIAALRADADTTRYLNDPAMRQRTAALDEEAAAKSSSAALGTVAIWVVVAVAAAGAWLRFT